MGALHDGHLALIDLAKEKAKHVTASIYVNPTQFGPSEDFDRYPRTLEDDLAKLKSRDVDLVYCPRTEDLYPNGPEITVTAGKTAEGLESDFRPGFFDGVCTVVHRLFEQVQPTHAVFGEKDYQQLMVIREMTEAHALPIKIIGAPTIRDAHGLALSSRNAYLNASQLKIARMLNVILKDKNATKDDLLRAGFTKVDYLETRWDGA